MENPSAEMVRKPRRELTPFYVMELVRKAQHYDDVIHFEVGQPDLPPPPAVGEALAAAVAEGRYAYTESLGLYELRRRIADHYLRDYGVEIDPSRILITPGTSLAFMVAYELLAGPGDRIGMQDPSYPCYKNFAAMVDAEAVFLPAGPEKGYRIGVADLEGRELDVLHLSSPSNPTGTLYPAEDLKQIVDYCRERGIAFVSDELYHGLVYENPAHSALEFGDEVIVINGFSKYFCMPGLRLGWMVLPEALVRPAEIVAQNLFISAPTLSQYAALEAFDYGYLETVRRTFSERRDFLYDALSEYFAIDARPDGAFYLWCDVSRYTGNAVAFSEALLEEVHVAVTPGIDFGKHGTEHHLRFAYTREIAHMVEGVARIRNFLERYGG
jgi:aspartate/methionine/tyrosine aminotransferase